MAARRIWSDNISHFEALLICNFRSGCTPHPAPGKARLRLANSSQSSPPIGGRGRVRGALVPMPPISAAKVRPKSKYHWRTTVRITSPTPRALRRLLRRPRRFARSDLRPDWPSTAETRRSSPSSCPAATAVNVRRSPIQILQHLEMPELPIAHQPNHHPKHPRKSPGECHLSNWLRGISILLLQNFDA
jgi:hypothetical protein